MKVLSAQHRKIEAQRRQWWKMEQVLRSKIGPDMCGANETEKKWWQMIKDEVLMVKANFEIEIQENAELWLDKDWLSEYKIKLGVAYGKWWGGRARARKTGWILPEGVTVELTSVEKKESARLITELIYWHLNRELSEREKFQIGERLME